MLLADRSLASQLLPFVITTFWVSFIPVLQRVKEGVQQDGDPLGPALIGLTIHSVVKDLQSELYISYLNDITIGGYWEDIVHDFRRMELLARDVGLSLILSKCEVICRDHTTLGFLVVNISGLMYYGG